MCLTHKKDVFIDFCSAIKLLFMVKKRKETWQILKPIAVMPNPLYVKEIKDNYDGLSISLQNREYSRFNPSFGIIKFDTFLTYRVTDEGDLLKTLYEIENPDCLGISFLFTVDNSLYLKWFCEQCYDIHDKNQITHYLIATTADVVDILNLHEPRVILSDSSFPRRSYSVDIS